jgi:hypothetical protein
MLPFFIATPIQEVTRPQQGMGPGNQCEVQNQETMSLVIPGRAGRNIFLYYKVILTH